MNQQCKNKKNLLRNWSVILVSVFFSLNAQAQIVLHEATDVTQTKATLSADFPDLNATHGFQYKYGTLPELDAFAAFLLTPTSDPVTFTQGAKGWRTVNSRGWIESYYDDTSSSFTSDFSTTVTFTEATPITFEWKVSSQENVGKLQFVVDGKVVLSITGETEFEAVSYDLSVGNHTLRWQYVRTSTENIGDGIGQLRNLNIQNTTAGEWLDWPTTDATTRLANLYPSQDYLFRAYSVSDDKKEYSSIRQFRSLDITLGTPRVVSKTQTTATIECDMDAGDAEVEAGFYKLKGEFFTPSSSGGAGGSNSFVIRRAVPPELHQISFSDAFYDSDSQVKPEIDSDGYWNGSSGEYVYNTNASSYHSYAKITITFTLEEASSLSFDYKTTGGMLYYIEDGKTINHKASDTYKTVCRLLPAGTHTIKWESYYTNTSYIRNVNINTGGFVIPLAISDGKITCVDTGLNPGTIYSVQPYLIPTYSTPLEDKWPIKSSSVISFSTDSIFTTTAPAINIRQASATIRATIDKGDATIVAKGLQYKLRSGNTWMTPTTVENGDSIYAVLSSLKPNTEYVYRSFIQASKCDTIFSAETSFTTASVRAIQPSVVSTTQTTAKLQGTVDYGDADIYSCGMQFKPLAGDGEWETKEYIGEGETFTFDFSGLHVNTSYTARTYVERLGGTIYSDALVFNTKGIELFIDSITNVYQRSAIVHGHILRGDAPEVTNRRMIVYKTTETYKGKEFDDTYKLGNYDTITISSENERFTQEILIEPGYVFGVELQATAEGKEFSMDTPLIHAATVEVNDPDFIKALTKEGSSQFIHVESKDSHWYAYGSYVQCYYNYSSTVGHNMPLSIEFELKDTLTISFYWSVSGYKYFKYGGYYYNKMFCYIDGNRVGYISHDGIKSETFTTKLDAGKHTIRWETMAYDTFYGYISKLNIPRNSVLLLTDEERICYAPFFLAKQKLKDITQTTATLQAKIQPTNEEGVEYGFYDIDGMKISAIMQDSILSANITGLVPNEHYKYYAVSKTADGQEYRDSVSFNTLPVTVSLSKSNVTQTTATIDVKTDAGTVTINNMKYKVGYYGNWQTLTGTSISLTGLSPNSNYRVYLQWEVMGTTYNDYIDFKTSSVYVYAGTATPLQTSALVEMGTVKVGTATKTASGIVLNDKTYTLEEGETVRVTELIPNTKYSCTYFVDTEEGGRVSVSNDFTTQSITIKTEPASNISNRSATMNGTIDCDDYSSAAFGFQWKQMEGWNSDPAFTKGVKNEDGTISVALVNGMLEPNTDYQYRTAVRYQGQVYYASNWETFRTESEFVYYPATVYTLFRTDRENNCLILCGYYVAGSETVTKQGYEYWINQSNARSYGFAPASENNVVTITTDESMQYSLDLEKLVDGNYSVRAFVTTSSGITTYGNTLTFGVQNQMNSIVEIENGDICLSTLGKTLIVHNAMSLSCSIYTLNGTCIARRKLTGDYEKFELQQHAVYVVRLSNGMSYKIKL
jgi:hypothetical protein